MALWSRRGVLVVGVLGVLARVVGVAAQGLDKFMVPSAGCSDDPVTPSVSGVTGFVADAPIRSSIAGAGEAGERLTLTGIVSGVTCGPIAGARVDVWQADAKGVMDPRHPRLYGRQATGATGDFRFESIVPGAPAGKAPCLNLRVEVKGRATLTTRLFFPDDPRNAADAGYRLELLLKVTRQPGGRSATCHIVFNL